MNCPRCQAENKADARFCEDCGARLEATCPSCGTSVTPGKKFCRSCGAAIATDPGNRFASPDSYTPKHLAEKILTTRSALEGERKQVTVLFADLKGSMELLADRDPEEARKILDPVLERMMEAVHRYEGTVNQVMGDGIMALFGAPLAHEDHAVRACYAALRMQEIVKKYADEVRRSHAAVVKIRVGLNSGEVVVRAIGSDLHMDYTAVGQTTHLAARMEQLADPGAIVITPETLALAEGYVEVKPLGPVPVKGLPDPLEIFELMRAGQARTRLQAAALRGLTRFVGRDAEVEHLRRVLGHAGAGRGQAVAIVGEAGVGKSRLTHEFTHSHRVQDWLILEASSVSYGKATSYLPVIDLLKSYFKIGDLDTHREMRDKVMGRVLGLDRALEPQLPPLLALLDVPVEDGSWQALDPAQRRQRTLNAVKHLLLRESQSQPLLVVFEDLHWIDAETQALLDSLVESLPPARLLLLVNCRPEYQHGWGRKTYYSQLRLDALPPESAGALLSALLGDDPALEPLRQLLVRRGNPFFVEESIRTLVETGALAGERGAYRLSRPIQAIEVPATVQVILAARIDRLPADDKELLQTASVIGKDVPFVLLRAVAELTEDAVRRGLADLQTAEFLYETQLFPDPEYTFKHALTHEVAYGTLPQERRKALHARILDAIERSYPDRLSEHVERLAHHAVHAGMWERAVRYLRQAAGKAVTRSADREAIALFEQALAALHELPESPETLSEALDIRLALGPCLSGIHGPGSSEFEASYVAARELCRRLDDRTRVFPTLWGLCHVSFNRGLYREAQSLGEELLSVAREGGDSVLLLESHHSLWTVLYGSGDLDSAELHIQEGLSQYDPQRHHAYASVYGGHDPGACCLNFAALTAWMRGYPDRAIRYSHEALRLCARLGHPRSTSIALYYAAWVHYQRGETASTVEKALAGHQIAVEQGLAVGRSILLARLAGREMMEDSELDRLHQSLHSSWWLWLSTFSACLLAEACARAGRPDKGLALLSEVPEHSLEMVYSSEIYRCRGQLLLSQGPAHAAAAEQCFRTALEVASRGERRSLELRAVTSLSRLLQTKGHREDARQMLTEIYSRFSEGFDTADLRDARMLLDELSTASR
jgi:class 3 adenylate cyclase/tetratricopeptide (TPR) repeat protein